MTLPLNKVVTVVSLFRLYVSLISAFGEMKLIELAALCFPSASATAKSCFHLVIFSWYQFYSASRALNNPIEVTLFILSFYQLHKDGMASPSVTYLMYAGPSILIRSSGFACYFAMFLYHFFQCGDKIGLVFGAVKMTLMVLAMGLGYDFLWYGRITIAMVNFLTVNVIDGVAVLFGTQGGYSWYLVQGFPVINGLAYLFGLVGFVRYGSKVPIIRVMGLAVLFGWAFMEFGCAHKEFRYVHWSAPFFTLCAAPFLSCSPKWLTRLFGVANLAVAMYMGFIHQRGQIDMAHHFRSKFCAQNFNYTFYGPCHIMPGEYGRYCLSGAHLNIRQLQCDRVVMKDDTEVDRFNRHPAEFVEADLERSGEPDFVIFFDGHEDALIPIMDKRGYSLYDRFFHAHLPNDDQTASITVYRR